MPIAQQQVEDVEAAVGARSAAVAAWPRTALGGTRKEVCVRVCLSVHRQELELFPEWGVSGPGC